MAETLKLSCAVPFHMHQCQGHINILESERKQLPPIPLDATHAMTPLNPHKLNELHELISKSRTTYVQELHTVCCHTLNISCNQQQPNELMQSMLTTRAAHHDALYVSSGMYA